DGDGNPCLKCPMQPKGGCDKQCNDDQVCILTENTCSECAKWTCQPKNDPKCVTCPETTCTPCDNTSELWVQNRSCYSCGDSRCVKSKQCIICTQIYPSCVDQCPLNYKCHVWKQDCFTCAQARCIPENYNPEG
ncbi:17358_t:CDS:2, partial [Racocetra persica]